MIRNNICINSHPAGCKKSVENQIEFVKKYFGGGGKKPAGAPQLALVIGCSTGYGLASRLAAAFGYGAATVGISFEKEGSANKPGTPGFYNNLAFERAAAAAGLVGTSLNGDAFSAAMKDEAIAAVKEAAARAGVPAKLDLIIYSLASPVRTDPATGITHKSVIKPIGSSYSGDTIDMMTGKINRVSAEPASAEEVAATVKVMGGEDWELWMDALGKAELLAGSAKSLAYTYIGPELSWSIYKNGTIGQAKKDLERAAAAINKKFARALAWVSVNKAVVTRASAVIPIIPFYISCLFRVMKDKKLHEGCIEQICRLFKERLYASADAAAAAAAKIPVDGEGRIRIDDWEMRDDVQKAVVERMAAVTEENIWTESDVAGFKHDFLEAHGFDVAGIDYDADVKTDGY
jgi:enoyl-[acyl-carrier protein] reductase/trans-2-enoyl-CoA reductase (NAD+)